MFNFKFIIEEKIKKLIDKFEIGDVFIDNRGQTNEAVKHNVYENFKPEYSQSHLPVREQAEAVDNIDNLYSRYADDFEETLVTLIPYASFANWGASNMCVWHNVI